MGFEEFTEEYEDELRAMETAIIGVYRRRPALLDYSVAAALDALARGYKAEARGHTAAAPRLEPLDREVYEAVRQVCENLLGRGEQATGAPALSLDETLACLNRIQKSVNKWNKSFGRRGYLDFVKKYV